MNKRNSNTLNTATRKVTALMLSLLMVLGNLNSTNFIVFGEGGSPTETPEAVEVQNEEVIEETKQEEQVVVEEVQPVNVQSPETNEESEEALEEEVVEETTQEAEEVIETEEVVEEVTEEVQDVQVVEAVVEETVVEEPVQQEEPNEEVQEEQVPEVVYAPFAQETTIDNVVISVQAEDGVFPVGAKLVVEKVPTKVEANVTEAIDQVRKEDTNVAVSYTFDIKVVDADNKEVQPTDNNKVKVLFKLAEVDNTNLETQVYHVTEEDLKVEELAVETEGDVAVVETEGFSFYTVEFTYNQLTYSMAGDSEILLSDILSFVGLTGEVSAVEVSNDTLFAAVQKDGVWVVEARNAFQTTEWMKVTIDGITYEIVVTDNIADGRWGEAYWWITDDGTLNIRALNGATAPALVLGNAPWASYKNQITKVVFKKGTSGYGVKLDVNTSIANLFNGYTNLTSVEGLSAADVDTEGNPLFDTTNAYSMKGMFQDCSSLKELDLSGLVNNEKVYEMQDMFNGCTNLETVILNNPEFKTRASTGTTAGSVQMQRMFTGCNSLKKVDFSNITVYGRSNWTQFKEMFAGNTSLEEIHLKNTKVPHCTDFTSMFEGCTNLKTVDLENFTPSDAVYMTNMFKDCTSLVNLDVSSFGMLLHIVNMDGFVQGDTSLETLNVDNLDNSEIGPTNNRHSVLNPGDIAYGNPQTVGGYEFGRDLGLKSCTSLKTLFARNGKVWAVKNEKGLPGNEYYTAANDADVFWWWLDTDEPGDNGTQLEFESDVTGATLTLNKRDYVDIITDRNADYRPATSPQVDMPDAGTNVNNNPHLNTVGAGFLAPGVYTITENPWEDKHVTFDDSYYRISYLGEKPFKVLIDGEEVDFTKSTNPDGFGKYVDEERGLVFVQSNNNVYVNTTNRSDWPTSGDYTIDNCNIEIIYQDVAIDVNGKKHDLKIKINSVKFKNLDRIPTYPNRGYHDQSRYYDRHGGGWYYRSILQATREGVYFQNYLNISEDDRPYSRLTALSGGAGTDIDFDLSIVDANPATTVIFFVDDLDVAEKQEWNRPEHDEPCLDNLPIDKSIYGVGGEGFVLGDGVDTSTVKFADHTGLTVVDGNKVITTGSDPSTSWSEFAVKCNAERSNLTWTSGVSCSTMAIKNTEPQNLGEFELQLQGEKQLLNRKGEKMPIDAGDFEFKIEKVSITPDGAPEPTRTVPLPETVANEADGTFTFSSMLFKTNGENALIDGSASTPYFPGTSPNGNTSGGGNHNTEKNNYNPSAVPFVYTYKVTEVIPSTQDPLISYDTTEHTVEVKFITPENDEEMAKGIKAVIKVDDGTPVEVWSKEVSNPVKLDKLLFKNTYLGQDLTIEKVVKGNAADTDKEFDFTVSFEKDGAAYEPTELPSDAQGSGGTYTFSLKGSETITFINIPHGVQYTVTESDYSRDHYITTIDGEEKREVTGKLEDDVTVTVTNTRNSYTVTYLDGDHGKSDGKGNESDKHYHDHPKGGNTVTPNAGYEFTGTYSYVILDDEGKVIKEGTTDDPTSIDIIGDVEFTPTYKLKNYTVTYEDGEHGTSSGPNETNKHYGEQPTGNNTVTPNPGFKFTGVYEYVMVLDDGSKVTGKTTNPKSIIIHGNLTFTPLYEASVKPTPTPTPTPKPTIKPVVPTPTPTVPVPNTGDNFHVWTYVAILVVALVAAIYGFIKLRKNKN